jgi:MoxR-like ATPase
MRELYERLRAEIVPVVVGQDAALGQLLAALACRGHVLIEGPPGVAKTLLARAVAQALGLQFARAQFTPDMLPSDLTGTMVLRGGELTFRVGPLFTNILLADEINRTPPKTQAALLEAMQEGQVSVDGEAHPLPEPFLVIATQNPIEYEGTYPLPEAQLDRFLLRVSFGYLAPDEEWQVLDRRLGRRQEEITLDPVTDPAGLLAMRRSVESVDVEESVGRYCVALAAATRRRPEVQVGASPRGALALVLTARALAVLRGRDYVIPEDVKDVGEAALAHRLTLRPESWMQRISPAEVVRAVLGEVPVPASRLPGGA